MAQDSRRPLIVLAVLAAVAVAVFVLGAAAGGGSPPDRGWRNPFGEFNPADALRPDELEVVSGSCTVGPAITFTGGSVLQVAPVTGGWPWQRVTRNVRLVGVTGAVRVQLSVQGKDLGTDLAPGDDVRLTFTRDGAGLALGCVAIGNCTVTLAEDVG